ncbi:PIN domain-containing protein [Glutamicibacter sp. NPDC087344]|uniref:PIN domain-containing protein n=1 Tax=Glutamicibacter sp. NPDC087344 TaxID=3363994 RepID=UPI00381FD43A
MQPGPTLLFLDANILLSRTLRDWFCLIDLESGHEGIQLRWSEDVLAEFLYHLRKRNPSASEEKTGGLRRRLENTCPEALISNYQIRKDLVQFGRDKFDAHVVAAAEHGGVDYLVTNNIKDFQPFADECEFEIYSADEMLCLIYERRPDVVRTVVQRQFPYWAKRQNPKTLHEALVAAQAPNFAEKVKTQLRHLAMSGTY